MNRSILTQVVANNPKDALEAANRLRTDGYQIAAYQAYLTTLDEITKRLIDYKIEINQFNETIQERRKPKSLELSTLFEVGLICLKKAQSTAYLLNPSLIPPTTSHNVSSKSNQTKDSNFLQPPTIPTKSSSRAKSLLQINTSKNATRSNEKVDEKVEVRSQPPKSQTIPIFMSKSTPIPTLENETKYGTSRFSRLSEIASTDFRKKLDFNLKGTFTRREAKHNRERSVSIVSTLRSKFDLGPANSSFSNLKPVKKEDLTPTQSVDSDTEAMAREPVRRPSLRARLSDQLLSLKIDSGAFIFSNTNPSTTTVESPVHIKPTENGTLAAVKEGKSDTSTVEELPAEPILVKGASLIDVRPEFCADVSDLVQAKFQTPDSQQNNDFKCVQLERIPYIPRSPLLGILDRTTEKLELAKSELVKLAKSKIDSAEKDTQFEALKSVVSNCNNTMERVSRLTRVDSLNYHFNAFPPALFAYQLTLIESSLFRAIPPTALLQHTSRTPHPRIVASTDFFNYLTRCVEMSVLASDNSDERVLAIKFWIKVGCHLQKVRNFQTLMAVNSALMSPPLRRLTNTWSEVSKKDSSRLLAIRNFMSETDNYACYRQHLDALGVGGNTTDYMSPPPSPTLILRKPIVPYLGLFIMDITYLLAATKKPSSSRKSSSASEISSTNSKDRESNSTGEPNRASEDSRLVDLMYRFRSCINGPNYPFVPPHRYLKQPSHLRTPTLGSLGSLTFNFNKPTPLANNSYSSSANKGDLNSDFKVLATAPSYKVSSTSSSKAPQRSRYLKNDSSLTQLQMSITHHLLSQVYVTERFVDSKSLEIQPKDDDSAVLMDENLNPILHNDQHQPSINLTLTANTIPPKINQNIESFQLFQPTSPTLNFLR